MSNAKPKKRWPYSVGGRCIGMIEQTDHGVRPLNFLIGRYDYVGITPDGERLGESNDLGYAQTTLKIAAGLMKPHEDKYSNT